MLGRKGGGTFRKKLNVKTFFKDYYNLKDSLHAGGLLYKW